MLKITGCRSVLCMVLVSCSFTTIAVAQAPEIGGLVPSGGMRGRSILIKIDGKNLFGATVIAAGPGVSAKSVNASATGDALSVELAIAADATFGPHDVRVVSSKGVSNGAQFWVDLFPNLAVTGPAAEPNPPPLIPRDRIGVINGRIASKNGRDRYLIQAQAGEVWRFDCFASRIRSKLEPVLELRDPRGALINQDQVNADVDPRFGFKFQKAATYTISVRDVHGAGGPNYTYRLLIGRTAFITRFQPRGERPGTTVGIQMEGPNVPARTPARVVIPKSARKGIYWADVRTPTGRAALIPFLVDDLPAAAVTETDFTMPLPLPPVALDGTFARYPRIRFFFRAEKGETFEFTMLGRQIGSGIKCALRVFDAMDRVVAEAVETQDKQAWLEFTPAEEGLFTVEAREADGKTGPDRYYRLNFRQIGPDFDIAILVDRVVVPAKGSAVLTAIAERKGGFTGPIAVRLEGLPPDVAYAGGVIPEGKDRVELSITSSGATPVSSTMRVVGEAAISGKTVVHEAQPREVVGNGPAGSVASGNGGPAYRLWDLLILAVVDATRK